MPLQNKMRTLKQQEFNKYKDIDNPQQQAGGGERKEDQHISSESQLPITTVVKGEELKWSEAAGRVEKATGEIAGNAGSSGTSRRKP
jgi:hypothetical protein